MNSSFFNPVRIVAGPGSRAQVGQLLPEVDGPVLLLASRGARARGDFQPVLDAMGSRRVIVCDVVQPNPGLDDLSKLAKEVVAEHPAAIVAVGGGSVIDAAKVLAVVLYPGCTADWTDVIRDGTAYGWPGRLPLVACPGTAGTGAEVTPFATIWDHAERRKYSLAAPVVFPDTAVLDPLLTLTMGEATTIHTGLDATSHALESLWNRNRSAFSELHARRALELILESFRGVLATPTELPGRIGMQYASVHAGIAISQTRTAIAHSISYPLTAHFGVPHGLACSFTLPELIARHLRAHPREPLAALLDQVLVLLEGLDLRRRLADYASTEQIRALSEEMIHPDRAGNYIGDTDPESIAGLLVRHG